MELEPGVGPARNGAGDSAARDGPGFPISVNGLRLRGPGRALRVVAMSEMMDRWIVALSGARIKPQFSQDSREGNHGPEPSPEGVPTGGPSTGLL